MINIDNFGEKTLMSTEIKVCVFFKRWCFFTPCIRRQPAKVPSKIKLKLGYLANANIQNPFGAVHFFLFFYY